ncbi:hypothetical protein CR513_57388, partial [Mucuna pruriens]
MVNIFAQISSIPMLNGTNFKWKEVVVIVLGCMDLDLALQIEKPILTVDNLQEVKIEKWKRFNRMCLMIMMRLISEAIRGFIFESQSRENIREYIMEMSNLTTKLKSLKLELGEDLIIRTNGLLVNLYLTVFKRKRGCGDIRLKVLILLQPLRIRKGRTLRVLQKGLLNERKLGAKRAKNVLELIHTDIYGPFLTASWNGQQYFITFIDDYSRYDYLYLIHEKSQSLDVFKPFKAEVELQLGKKIKAIKSDHGGNARILEKVEFGKEENIRNVVLEEESVNDIEHEDDIGLTEDYLIIFYQAMQSSNSQKCIDAMKDELKSMQDNDIWDLIELLEGLLHETKRFLIKNFEMKDLGEASFVLGIQILRDRSQGILRLSQENYISKVLERFDMKDSKPGDTLISKGDKFSLKQCPNNDLKRNEMQKILYASTMGV